MLMLIEFENFLGLSSLVNIRFIEFGKLCGFIEFDNFVVIEFDIETKHFFSKLSLNCFLLISLRVRSFKMEPSRMGSSFSIFMKRNAVEIFQNSKVMSLLST